MKRKISLNLSWVMLIVLQFTLLHNANAQQKEKMEDFVKSLMKKMTLEEKIAQLNTDQMPIVEPKIDASGTGGTPPVAFDFSMDPIERERKSQESAMKLRVPVPIMSGRDVIHGFETIFPIPLATACSWDLDMIEKSARIAASEASTSGISWTYSPMVDIARDPRWGRIAECAGEDPWWGSKIAAAMVHGYQGDDLSSPNTILACVKHFALYGGAEAGRDYSTVDMSAGTMFNIYLKPYEAAVKAGAESVMTSFNVVNSIPATGNKWLLDDILRKKWGFDGLIVTDYGSIREMMNHGVGSDLKDVALLALKAGVDIDMASKGFSPKILKALLDEGKITEAEIDQACCRILNAKYKLGLFDDPYRYLNKERMKNELLSEEHRSFARDLAARSCVLLKNSNQLLPLKKSGTIAVIGPLGNAKDDMLGCWAMSTNKETIVTVADGIKKVGGNNVTVLFAKGANATDDSYLLKYGKGRSFDFGNKKPQPKIAERSAEDLMEEAMEVAAKADVIVATLGELASWSGEASSRSDIIIPESQKNLLKALIATGKPVVLVLINGRPLTLTWEDANVNAILEAWQGGTEAGNAIADVLFGDYNPSGKITATFPRSVGQIPVYYNALNTGRPFNESDKYTSKYMDVPNDPLYPFGYGLSYTTFTYGDIKTNKSNLSGGETLEVFATITNTGNYSGEEVVQLYVGDPVASISRPVKELKNFKKIMLKPGETKTVSMSITIEDLKFYNADLKYDWEPGEFIISVGPNSRDLKQTKVVWVK